MLPKQYYYFFFTFTYKLQRLHQDEVKYEESRLIAMLAEDSEYAFQLIFDRHRKKIYQTALKYLKSPVLAQEVVQDVFLKLWLNRKKLRTDYPIKAWLHTLTKNNLINRLKKIATEWQAIKNLSAIAEVSVSNASYKLEEKQYNVFLQRAIASLPSQQQKVFILARHRQMTYIEIAEELNISPLTVKTHMARALDAIRASFADNGIILSASIFFLFQ